jgi:hypothetical protein
MALLREGSPMFFSDANALERKLISGTTRLIASYDSGYEHSLEHLIELQRLVNDGDELLTSAVHWQPAKERSVVGLRY